MAAERFQAARESDLATIAAAFAATLEPGAVVTLSGELGAGKTAFARAIVAALHGHDRAQSPTFTFWNRYNGEPPVNHLDFYRIDDPGEAAAIGLGDAFDPASITLIEWPQRAPQLVPAGAVRVVIEGAGEAPREITIDRS
jgi:tRNA threonylcarbamoyladenosine biosynthesis protein TsaE